MTRSEMVRQMHSITDLEEGIRILREYMETQRVSDDDRQFYENLIATCRQKVAELNKGNS